MKRVNITCLYRFQLVHLVVQVVQSVETVWARATQKMSQWVLSVPPTAGWGRQGRRVAPLTTLAVVARRSVVWSSGRGSWPGWLVDVRLGSRVARCGARRCARREYH